MIKIKNFCATKDPLERIQRQATEREQILSKLHIGYRTCFQNI